VVRLKQRLRNGVFVHEVGGCAEVDERLLVACVQDARPIRGGRGLLKEQDGLQEARLARAIGAEEHRNGGEPHRTRVRPPLEVLEMHLREHRYPPPRRFRTALGTTSFLQAAPCYFLRGTDVRRSHVGSSAGSLSGRPSDLIARASSSAAPARTDEPRHPRTPGAAPRSFPGAPSGLPRRSSS
jgi:hypothetical protein